MGNEHYRPGYHWQRDDPTPFAELAEEAQVAWDRDIPQHWHGRPITFHVGELFPGVHALLDGRYSWWIVASVELDDHSLESCRYDPKSESWGHLSKGGICNEESRRRAPYINFSGHPCRLPKRRCPNSCKIE